uniref:Adhesion G protein-coupled receptor F3b n=1 Tax=Cyprinus carpio TaxID=7962 RepID=A0A8C1I5U8_CYPCA
GPDSNCTNEIGSYYCSCQEGFTATNSSLPISIDNTCRDVNECVEISDVCGPNSICNNTVGSYNCWCMSGYNETDPNLPINSNNTCKGMVNMCRLNSHCYNENGSCLCYIDECLFSTSVCGPNANCTNEMGSYNCSCQDGFTVTKSSLPISINNTCTVTDINECLFSPSVCGPDSNCTNEIGSYNCSCLDGFTVINSSLPISINDTCRGTGAIWTCKFRPKIQFFIHLFFFGTFSVFLKQIFTLEFSCKNEKLGDGKEDETLTGLCETGKEGLVKNIRINATEGYNSSNIQLQICRNGSSCNRTVFNVDVELNATADMVKTVGLQSLANRLPKLGYENATFPSIVVSSTVENNTQASVNIRMAFPNEQGASAKMSCVFWNVTELRWSNEGCEFVKGPGNLAYCECNHLTSFSMLMSKHAVSMPFLDQLTYVGLGVSICSLIVYIIIECLVWSAVVKSNLSHFRHTALLNIALCLLLHYFFLAMFFWMLCLSVMLVHQLIFVFSHIGKKMYMILGFTIGYVCPTVTVAVTYVYYDQTRDIPYYSSKTCWLTYKSAMQGSIHAFLFPVGTIVLVNLFSMVVVIATVLKPSGAESNKKGDKDAAKSIIKVIMFLTPVFGGTWILGLFVFLMDDFTQFITYVVHYTFTIVNSLQGFFILLTGCFAEKRVCTEIYITAFCIVSTTGHSHVFFFFFFRSEMKY